MDDERLSHDDGTPVDTRHSGDGTTASSRALNYVNIRVDDPVITSVGFDENPLLEVCTEALR
jgi:hypothetical protein